MTSVPCHYYDGRTSARREAGLTITPDGILIVAIAGIESRLLYPMTEVRIPNRIANTPRHLLLPEGALCEVRDNDGLDAMRERAEGQPPSHARRFERLLHRLDSTWRGSAAALAVTAAILYSFTEWGAPAVATGVVAITPPEAEAVIGDNLLAMLPLFGVLDSSELQSSRQDELRAVAEAMGREAGIEDLDLQFFSAPGLGPNAFALPGNTVVLTDELVALAEHDEEIVAVLAHEVGHVAGRHVMRGLAQTSSMLIIWTAFTGDASVAALSILGPDQLLAQRYSRTFERQADQFAIEYLLRNDIPPTRLGDILQRLEEAHADSGVPNWLASHPGTEGRRREAQDAAESVRDGSEALE